MTAAVTQYRGSRPRTSTDTAPTAVPALRLSVGHHSLCRSRPGTEYNVTTAPAVNANS